MTYLGTEPLQVVRITVENPGPRPRLEALAAQLGRLPAVRGVAGITYDPAIARIDLDYAGPMAPLVDYLERCRVEGQTLEVRRATPGEVTVAWDG